MTDVYRRTALRLAGAGAGMALLAGCSSSSDDSDDESDENDTAPSESATLGSDGSLPAYASVLPENDAAEYFYGAIDLETMSALIEDEGAEAGNEPTDPLLGNPIVVALLCSFGIGLLGSSPSLNPYVANNQTDDGNETFLFVDGVYTFSGTYDFEGLTSDLDAAGYAAETVADAYAVYTASDTDEVVGVSDDVFAFSYPNADDPEFDPLAAVERTVATAAGQRAPKHERDDDFEALLREGDPDGITLCLYTSEDDLGEEELENDQPDDEADGIEFAFDAYVGAYGVYQRLSVTDSDVAARATAVVAYESDDQIDDDRLTAELGTDSDAVSFDRAGSAVLVEAEYKGNVVEE